jgi:hypothetical protein
MTSWGTHVRVISLSTSKDGQKEHHQLNSWANLSENQLGRNRGNQ